MAEDNTKKKIRTSDHRVEKAERQDKKSSWNRVAVLLKAWLTDHAYIG